MSCPYCGNGKDNTFDWNEFGQFLIKCSSCKVVFRPSKADYSQIKKDEKAKK
jgi:rubredoxin